MKGNRRWGFGIWIALLALLLALGVALTVEALREYDRAVHIPRGSKTAGETCAFNHYMA